VTIKLSTVSLFLGFLILFGVGKTVYGESPQQKEYAIKAAFLYNFAKFVEWPKESFENPKNVLLCVLGKNPFGSALHKMQGKEIQGRKLKVTQTERAEDIGKYHIVFVGRSEKDDVAEILANLKGHSVLTVGDMEGFAHQGGMINFIMKQRKVRFEINADAAEQAGLKISSKLLKLATIVSSDDS
jgi:hypothetical protein